MTIRCAQRGRADLVRLRAMPTPLALVLAAGKGTRMESDLPKVLHRLAGRPLVDYPLRAAATAGARKIVFVVGHGADEVRAELEREPPSDIELAFALQAEQKGTGHAVYCALEAMEGHDGPVLILSGDVPLLRAQTLRELAAAASEEGASMSMLSFRPPDPTGYGRVLRDAEGRVHAIREQRDASDEELAIGECNAGVYCVDADVLREELPKLGTDNAQGEMYLTDLVEARAVVGDVRVLQVPPLEVAGVNTPEQLAALEAVVRLARGGDA